MSRSTFLRNMRQFAHSAWLTLLPDTFWSFREFSVTLDHCDYLEQKRLYFDTDISKMRYNFQKSEFIQDRHRMIYRVSGAWLDLKSLADFESALQEMEDQQYLGYIEQWLTAIRAIVYKDVGLSIGMLHLNKCVHSHG
jgi:hypothetical protein